MRTSNSQMISAATSTGTTVVNSVVLSTIQVVSASFQMISSSASNAGSLQIQFSNDPADKLQSDSNGNLIPVNWSNLGSAATVAAGALASVQVPQSSYAGYRWLRAVWTPSSGAGTITVNAFTIGF